MRTILIKQNKQSSVFATYNSNSFGDQIITFYKVLPNGDQQTLGMSSFQEGSWIHSLKEFRFELKCVRSQNKRRGELK